MLWEWLCAMSTPTPPWARRMGFADEHVAIRARAERCAGAWAPHRARCADAVSRFLEGLPRGGRVVALGAGHCDDLPLEQLLAHFDEVVLADLVFARSLRARRDLRCWTVDLLGLGPILDGLPSGAPLPGPPDTLAGLEPDDVLLSVNLLSQLADRPAGALVQRGWPEAAVADWAAAVVAAHLRLLQRHRALLITDYEQQWTDPKDGLVERVDLLWGVELGVPEETWTWRLAPAPEAHPRWDELRLVGRWTCGRMPT